MGIYLKIGRDFKNFELASSYNAELSGRHSKEFV